MVTSVKDAAGAAVRLLIMVLAACESSECGGEISLKSELILDRINRIDRM